MEAFDSRGPRVVLRRYYNLGIAVDTERGLVVPVVHNADGLTTRELMAAIDDVSKRARQGKLEPDDLVGGTFTITNLGGIGGTGFTPIIDWPQVAILGLGRASDQRLPLPLSYDHRAINGAEAARFVRTVAEMLQSSLGLLLDH